jgi:hypothetical protein
MKSKVDELCYDPAVLECDDVRLFEGEDSRSIANKEQDPDYWVTLRYITENKKVFSLEISTFKKSLGKEFFEDFVELLDKHTINT